jgi:hypothetical protein
MMELFAYIHDSHYVYATEDETYLYTWNGGSTFNLYNIHGENIDCFVLHDVENAEQAKQAIENHIKENQSAS